MGSDSVARSLVGLARKYRQLSLADPLTQCLAPSLTRSMATVVDTSAVHSQQPSSSYNDSTSQTPTSTNPRPVIRKPLESELLTTLYHWPSIEPIRLEKYPSRHLGLPLRRDLLHRAVVFEGDAARAGTASTKWRDDVRGSGRKLYAQKGTGKARVGDKKSPVRRGGGVAFGPHPRDFTTQLPRKIYDLAWRTALSHRYSKGELIVIDNTISVPWQATPHLINDIFLQQQWGKGCGRSTLVTLNSRPRLNETMSLLGEHGVVKDLFDVDVKDLLETGRIIIERFALNALIDAHSSDIGVSASLEMAHRQNQSRYKAYRAESEAADMVDGVDTMEENGEENDSDILPVEEQPHTPRV